MVRFGFARNQAEKDAWEVKDYQDSLTARVADHHDANDNGEEHINVKGGRDNAGGYKQNYRAYLLALAAYMGLVLARSLVMKK
jgi:hypothetical protein